MTEQLVGYRVDRSEDGTLLGRPAEAGEDAEGAAGTPVRLVRMRAGGTRLEALTLAAGPHVEALLDVGTAANGDLVLVLPELRVRVPELLAEPGWPAAGEAVTVLAPLLGALARAHDAGVAHGAVAAGAVRFDAAGAPVLCGFEAAVVRRAGAAPFEAAVRRDLDGAAALCGSVLRAAGRPPEPVVDRIRRADLDGAVATLFELADPEPVRLAPGPPVGGGASWPLDWPPARFAPPSEVPDGGTGDRLSGRSVAVAGARAVAERARASLRTVRPRIWAAAGTAVVLLAAALVLLPGRGADAVAPSAAAGPAVAHASAAASRPAAPAGPVAPRDWSPARATSALLAARARCLAGDHPVACLDRVDAAGSPVAIADRAAAEAGVEAVLPGGGRPTLVSFHADVALSEVGRIAVLAVREPGGWRLRDVLAPPT